MNLVENISPFGTVGVTPPASPAKASFSSPATRPDLKLKKLSLGGGYSSVTTPNVEEEVRDAMQDSPVLMRFHSPRTDNSYTAEASSPSTSRRPTSSISSSNDSRPDSRISFGSPVSAQSGSTGPRPRPVSLQFRSYQNVQGSAPRGRTPQVRRARRRSWEKDSLGSGSVRSIIEEDEQGRDVKDGRRRSDVDVRSELDKRRSLMGRGMGMGPRRTAPMTLVERHAELLSAIANKETQLNETRQELTRQESELNDLKARWQSIVSRSAMMSTTTAPSTSTSSNRHSFSHPRFESDEREGDSSSTGVSMGEMINPTVAIEGGKKLLGQLMGSMNLNGSSVEPQEQPKRTEGGGTVWRPARPTRNLSLIAGTGVNRVRPPDVLVEARTKDRPSLDMIGRRASTASSTTSAKSQLGARSPREEEPLSGLGFGQALEGMVDPGGWTKRWGDVMSNPQVQAGSKRASAFFSSSLADTYNLLAQALPTPNLAALTSPTLPGEEIEPASRSGQTRDVNDNGRRRAAPMPSRRERVLTGRDVVRDDVGRPQAGKTGSANDLAEGDTNWDW